MQQDSNVLAQLIRTSDVLGFVTDVSEFNHPDENRVRVPIQDADAHATFYVVAMIDAPQACWISSRRLGGSCAAEVAR